jgi:hypothetical protein
MLFQERDRIRLRSDQINYEYFAENDEDPGPMEMAFLRPLREVVPRLDLLGFTLDHAKLEYEARSEASRQEREDIADDEKEPNADIISFEEFVTLATSHPIQSLDDTFISLADRGSERVVRGRFGDEKLWGRLPHSWLDDQSAAYSERSYFGGLIAVLHPYSVLRVLARNAVNLDANVVWQYGPLVHAGWASESEFIPDARRTQTFLVATEGSSDAHILKHALALLRPEIADFFRFIDVSERHPFPGTGNLVKFAEGLAKIDVQNQVVFLFDNDAEGFDAYQRVSRLTLPTNMRAMMLPDLPQFRSFPALGPEGLTNADINRRAAAIECYLDLEFGGYPPAKVIWTTYKRELGVYQGALECKEVYTKAFLEQSSQTMSAERYRVEKLQVVLDALISECSSIAAEQAMIGKRPVKAS